MKWKRIILFLLAVPIVILLCLLLFADWAWGGGYIKSSLDSQYIPTAEHLIQNPISTPNSLRVNPPPGSVMRAEDIIIVGVPTLPNAPLGSRDEIANWTHLFINNQRISRRDFGVGFIGGLFSDVPGYVRETTEFGFSPDLNPGVHIFEIRVGKSLTALLNPAEAYTYTWAYRVE
jgi:hypothetical protein